MKITIYSEADITRVEVVGSIDGKTASEAREEIRLALEKAQKLILDMSRVDYLSSAGLRLILLLYREFTAKDGKLVLLGVSAEIRAVMSHTGFLNFFTLVDSQQEALRAVA